MLANNTRIKYACYTANLSGSIIVNLPPVLFLTFRALYGISYTQLGLLVLIGFSTQLAVDLLFSFFSDRISIARAVCWTPVMSLVGLLLYAAAPLLFPNAVYIGLVLGTLVFSMAGGLGEVLLSPVFATLPSDNPDRDMSKLHSVYAWGVVGVIVISTLFLRLFGPQAWQWLSLLFCVLPATSLILFLSAEIPPVPTAEKAGGVGALLRQGGVWFCIGAIFVGGASECTMGQWCSGYLEGALHIPKLWGDLLGVAMFSVMLGFGRTLYAKYGRRIESVLFFSAIGAFLCYLSAVLTPIASLGLIACALCGICVAMMWPGCLVVATSRYAQGGVVMYALMAAGGDLGASVGPQLVGIVTDVVGRSAWGTSLAASLSLSTEQLGMKCGMLVGAFFPLCAIVLYGIMAKKAKQKKQP